MSKRSKEDNREARDAAYKSAVCPFEPGSRRAILFAKHRARHDAIESQLADVAAVYGYPWPLPGMVARSQ